MNSKRYNSRREEWGGRQEMTLRFCRCVDRRVIGANADEARRPPRTKEAARKKWTMTPVR